MAKELLILHVLLSPADLISVTLYCMVLVKLTMQNCSECKIIVHAHVECKSPYNTNVTELLRELHWLSVRHRITYKFANITHSTRNCQQPDYLLDSLISHKPARTLRSSSSDLLIVPHRVKTVTVSRAFRVAAPTIGNNLPDFVKVQQIRSISLSVI